MLPIVYINTCKEKETNVIIAGKTYFGLLPTLIIVYRYFILRFTKYLLYSFKFIVQFFFNQ